MAVRSCPSPFAGELRRRADPVAAQCWLLLPCATSPLRHLGPVAASVCARVAMGEADVRGATSVGLVCAGLWRSRRIIAAAGAWTRGVAVLILLLPVGHVRGARVAPGAELTRHAAIRRTTRIAARPATRRGGPFGPSRWWGRWFLPARAWRRTARCVAFGSRHAWLSRCGRGRRSDFGC